MLNPLRLGRRRDEERLRRSEELFRVLADSLPDHAVCILDGDGRVVAGSSGVRALHGYEREDVPGSGLSIFYARADVEVGIPERRLETARSQGRSEDEGWRARKDGSLFWGRTVITLVGDREEAGGFCMVTRDMTPERQANERLEQHEARLVALMRHSKAMVFLKDAGGRYVHVNERYARHMGLAPGDILSRSDEEAFGQERAAKHRASDARVLESGRPVEMEQSVQYADGLHAIRVHKFPVTGADGRMLGVGGILLDVTAARRAEEEIGRLGESLTARDAQIGVVQRELDSFTYTVSHDLRAPLRHINSFARLILEESGQTLTAETRRHLDIIATSAVRLGRLIDDLLHYSRMNRLDLRKEFVDLNAVIEEARRGFAEEIGSRKVEWKLGELPRVHADAALLRLAFTLVISNAVKFTRHRDPAVIEIDARTGEGDEVIVRVRDNGAGFDPLFKHKLFGMFQRLHHESEFEGVGMGLATVKRIVERHGGHVWAEGTPGSGAAVHIALTAAS